MNIVVDDKVWIQPKSCLNSFEAVRLPKIPWPILDPDEWYDNVLDQDAQASSMK